MQRVRQVAAALIREVGVFRPDAAAWAWEVNVFDSPEVNAFCAPGGKIGVSTGILQRLQLTDAEIAAVIGHEIAHALREHSREKASQAALSQAVVQGIANSGSRNAGVAATAADVGSLFLIRLPFSREMESEADVMGLELMARAGFEPRAAANVWRKMLATLGSSGAHFTNTHPSHEQRISDLEANVPRVLALYQGAPGRRVDSEAPTTPTLSSATASVAAPPLGLGWTAVRPLSVEESAPKRTPAPPLGQEAFQVEQMARREGCDAAATATMTAKGPGFELYNVSCKAAVVWSVRCEFGNCRVLK